MKHDPCDPYVPPVSGFETMSHHAPSDIRVLIDMVRERAGQISWRTDSGDIVATLLPVSNDWYPGKEVFFVTGPFGEGGGMVDMVDIGATGSFKYIQGKGSIQSVKKSPALQALMHIIQTDKSLSDSVRTPRDTFWKKILGKILG